MITVRSPPHGAYLVVGSRAPGKGQDSYPSDIFEPYEKHHSTVKDACELAEELGVRNLLLFHTEDHMLERRKELYAAEGKRHFSGALWVPDDLETIEI